MFPLSPQALLREEGIALPKSVTKSSLQRLQTWVEKNVLLTKLRTELQHASNIRFSIGEERSVNRLACLSDGGNRKQQILLVSSRR